MYDFSTRYPPLPLTIDPLPLTLGHGALFLGNPHSDAMLLTVSPTANVFVPVGPFEGALTVLLAVLEITFVATAVRPGLNSTALHV